MILHHRGFPIRKSADQCLFTTPRSLSQLIASFFGSWCQGIHLTLLFAWTFLCCSLVLNCMSFTWTWLFTLREKALIAFFWMFPPCNFLLRWNCSYYPNIGKTLNFDWSRYLMSSISVRFNSFLFSYSIFNEHKPYIRAPTPSAGRSGWTRTIDLALIRRAL